MIVWVQPPDVQPGYLYAVTALRGQPFDLEPYLAVPTAEGVRWVPADMFKIDTSTDGPVDITEELTSYALAQGFEFGEDDVWSLWSERDFFERVLSRTEDGKITFEAVHPIVLEAERLLKEEGTPDGQMSSWLRHSEEWSGSSFSALYNQSGCLTGAFVTIFTDNPYKLALLLRWLGAPRDLIARVTGIERH